MPVTARLSKRFYDRLGDEIANELVEWFNQVDAASREDLRALNELNFARFDAKLEQRILEVRAHADALAQRLDARIDSVAQSLDAKIDSATRRLGTTIDASARGLDAKIDRGLLELRHDIQVRLTEQTRWMILTWGVLLASIIGLYAR